MALTQFLFNSVGIFQLMAANGYIVVAPNRRGMPGHGVEWKRAKLVKDWGGQVMGRLPFGHRRCKQKKVYV